MPEPVSVPLQETTKLYGTFDGNDCTLLEGFELSIVFVHCGVSIGAFTSNVMRALLLTVVPVGSPGFALTVNRIVPWPSGEILFGDKNPACGSSGGLPVVGSSVSNCQLISPGFLSNFPIT